MSRLRWAEMVFPAMGTSVRVRVLLPVDAADSFAARCRRLVGEVEAKLSRFRADSDVSALARAPGRWIGVSSHTAAVLRASAELRVVTGGAFDPVWRLAPGGLPRAVEVDADRGLARVAGGGPVDLGGVAKGYTADLLAAQARAAGAVSALIAVGVSSLTVFGQRPAGGPWRVGIHAPGHGADQVCGEMTLPGGALSTSGSDQQGDHVCDPDSGRPAAAGVLQASALAPSGVAAEAYSTALLVRGLPLASRLMAGR
ncbi:MAG: FAD:protein FMN transferase, partial [Propionibacteriaceae bacterium]|nr:FAD:protein FMN transferase [Propionibacteriaceae bacterium]